MKRRKKEAKLDFMGYVGVSGYLPLDLGDGLFERMQQLALPLSALPERDTLKIRHALSDLSWKVRAEVDAGNKSDKPATWRRYPKIGRVNDGPDDLTRVAPVEKLYTGALVLCSDDRMRSLHNLV